MNLAPARAVPRWAVMWSLIGMQRLAAQDSLPPLRPISLGSHREIQISWGLVDFAIIADSVRGVGVYMAPSLASAQGAQHSNVSYIAFDPTYVHQWVTLVEQGIRKPWPDPRPATPLPVAAALPATSGRAFVLLARDSSPGEQTRFLLVYRDSVSQNGWTAYAREERVVQLLNALEEVSSLSRYDPEGASPPDSVLSLLNWPEVQQVPRLVSMQPLVFPSSEQQEGRVWVRYVVDPDGRVEPESMHVIFSNGPAYTERVRQALATAIYEPGRANGVAVRVLCFQVFTFRFRRW